MEWLVLRLGAALLDKLVFKPILEKVAGLTGEALEDYAKDFLKDRFGDIAAKLQKKPEPIKVAIAQALVQFLLLVQEELKFCDLDDDEIQRFEPALEKFLSLPDVKGELGKAFQERKTAPSASVLRLAWAFSPDLPSDFDWESVGRTYLREVQKIRRESDELRTILDSENITSMSESLEQLAGPKTDFDLDKYAEGLLERYGNLQLEALDTEGSAYSLKLWRMFIPQNVREINDYVPQLYELPKEELKRLLEEGAVDEAVLQEGQEEERKQRYVSQPSRPVLEITSDLNYPLLVVLGDPGSGKSTLLQYLAVNWAELRVQQPKDAALAPLPLLVELKQFARDKANKLCLTILEFFEKGSVSCRLNQNDLKERLNRGDAIALFDGLDEVFELSQREEVITAIHEFSNEFPNVRMVVTSRVVGYKFERLRNAGFSHLMLQDLDSEQIDTFIQKWHDLTYSQLNERERKRERLCKAIRNSRPIQELAQNPLLLTMMAILNRHRELPRDRAKLYELSSMVLLQQWDVEKALEDDGLPTTTVDYTDKQIMLRRVAYKMQGSETGLAGNLIAKDELENILADYLRHEREVSEPRDKARKIIEQLRSRNFVLCFVGAERYAFVHRTFLEYFCATNFVEQFEKKRTLTEDNLLDIFKRHWQDETWHEVLRLIASTVDESIAQQMISLLKDQYCSPEEPNSLILAASCLADVRNQSLVRSLGGDLLKKLKCLSGFRCGPQQAEQILTAIVTIWPENESIFPWLKDCTDGSKRSYIPETCVRVIAGRLNGRVETLSWLKSLETTHKNSYVRQAVVQELVRGWKNTSNITLSWLKQLAQDDDDSGVRVVAVKELARSWKYDSSTLPWLKQLLEQEDVPDYIRSAAMEEIARGWKDSPGTQLCIKQFAQQTEHESLQLEAVMQMARGWKDDPDSLMWLKTLAEKNEEEDVRIQAIQEIARIWKDDTDTLFWLKDRFNHDYYATVVIINEVASRWKKHPDTLSWLKEIAQYSNEEEHIRIAALRELVNGWKDNPITLLWVKKIAEKDRNVDVRIAAIEELAQGWKEDPKTFEWLNQLASKVDEGSIREAAIAELPLGWNSEADTLQFFRNFVDDDDERVRRIAIASLKGWKESPDILPLLKKCADEDESEVVRLEAVRRLVQGWKDDPGTPSFLKQLCQKDSSYYVRREVLNELVWGWITEPWIFEFLLDISINEPHNRSYDLEPSPRQTALENLVRQFGDRPKTLSLLRDRAENDPDQWLKTYAQEQLKRLTDT